MIKEIKVIYSEDDFRVSIVEPSEELFQTIAPKYAQHIPRIFEQVKKYLEEVVFTPDNPGVVSYEWRRVQDIKHPCLELYINFKGSEGNRSAAIIFLKTRWGNGCNWDGSLCNKFPYTFKFEDIDKPPFTANEFFTFVYRFIHENLINYTGPYRGTKSVNHLLPVSDSYKHMTVLHQKAQNDYILPPWEEGSTELGTKWYNAYILNK